MGSEASVSTRFGVGGTGFVSAIRGTTLLVAAATLACACGSNTKELTRETIHSADASVDAGDHGKPNDIPDAADTIESGGQEGDAGSGSADQTRSTGASSGTTTSAVTVTTASTADTVGTTSSSIDPSTTSTGLPPDWVYIEPVAEGLSDCAGRPTGGDTWCTYEVRCGATSIVSQCYAEGDAWDCYCRDGSLARRDYLLTGPDEKTACAASIELCAPNREEPEPECEAQIEHASDLGCRAADNCSTTVELEPGVTAVVLAKSNFVDCNVDGEFTSCSCDDGPYGNVSVFGTALGDTCTDMVTWCKTGFPEREEQDSVEKVCPFNSVTQSDVYCTITRTCGWRYDLDEGFLVLDEESQGVECYDEGCSCYLGAYLSGQASGGAPSERCEVMEEFCYGDVTPVPTGPVFVTNTQTGGAQSTCAGAVTAAQALTWGANRQVEIESSIETQCTRQEGNSWSCHCESHGINGSAEFSVEGEAFDDTCEAALDYCVARARLVPAPERALYYAFPFEFLSEPWALDAGG